MPLVLVHDLVDDKYVQGPEAVVSNINHKIDTIGDSNNKENVESGAILSLKKMSWSPVS